MKPKKNKRWRLVADVQIQGQLCVRLVFYWVLCQISMAATMVGFTLLLGESTDLLWRLLIPALTVSSLFLPIMLFDLIGFSNRFVGPLLNFRKRFSQFMKDGTVGEIRFRKGDYLTDLRDDFNKLQDRLAAIQQTTEKHQVLDHSEI